MQISNRMQSIINEIEYKKIADIGTDHGYIPIYCSLNKNMEKIIACDVNKEPLKNCMDNIKKYNLEEKIETRLSNGIKNLKLFEVDTIIIAGMGGNLIIDILKDNLELVHSTKQLILQPQSSIEQVRRFLHEIGFKITNEVMIFEDYKYYNIINCKKEIEDIYTEPEYFLGKILLDKKDKALSDYCKEEQDKLLKVKKNILNKSINKELISDKLEKLEKRIKFYDFGII